jgi:hypothetical protein
VAKTRKTASKSGSAKKASRKKVSGRKKAVRKTSKPTELDLRPLKKKLKEHIDLLSQGDQSNERVRGALARLQLLDAELAQDCDPTMILPLTTT